MAHLMVIPAIALIPNFGPPPLDETPRVLVGAELPPTLIVAIVIAWLGVSVVTDTFLEDPPKLGSVVIILTDIWLDSS
jgi:hypothetical protein